MKLLVVGGGGREHAIIKKLKESPRITEIFATPGNGGIAQDATCVPISATAVDEIVSFAQKESIDFVVVAPDDPLALGCVDKLEAVGIPAFGPNQAAARIESSKVFSKDLMKKYNIPTANYAVFTDVASATAYLETQSMPIVIKADGLALGKGVVIALTLDEAVTAVRSMMEDKVFGDAGRFVVIEEFLTGPEVSVLAFTDGTAIAPMVSSMDHKRALDGDQGLNTGGMGTVAPNPCYTADLAEISIETIFLPTLAAMRAEGCPFKGCLYFGLMLTEKGPKVIEYNCRFGDPETQVVLPLLGSDLLTIMESTVNGTLSGLDIQWKSGSAVCVVMASGGYPQAYAKGVPMTIGDMDATCYHAGTALKDGQLVTAGGRVLGITATADTLAEAMEKAYTATNAVTFAGAHKRTDIGRKALNFLEDSRG
ncbi:MAG: phosphoribosylamine--glycine ligase [Eubacteriales bacterium]